jgi:Cof subfamily protein (haloacid dehalogenase superfamily)
MQGKIVIFDLDDTLLDDNSRVSEFTLTALEKVREAGHILVFNTARGQGTSQEIAEIIKPDYAIYNGGAQIVDKTGASVMEFGLDKELCNAMIPELFALTNRFSMQADWFYTANPDYHAPGVKQFDFKNQEFPMGAYKIIAFSEDPERLRPLAERFDLDFTVYFNGPFCRFTRRGVSKASGNRELVRMLGRDLSDVIAFGDDHGDMEMLREAGVGVIMKNAKDELKEDGLVVSEFTNHEDGVAKFLLSYLGL